MDHRSLSRVLRAGSLGLMVALLADHRPAAAHAIESTLERVRGLTDSLVLQSRFGPDQPASDAEVRLVSPSGRAIALGRTDASGTLRFQVPSTAGAGWEVQVDQGPGHRDYLELPAAGPGLSSRSGREASLVERAWWSARDTLRQPQPLALVGLVALGSLGGVAVQRWRRR